MGLEVRRLVGDQGVAEGMAPAEGVVGERLDDVEQPRPERPSVAHPVDAVDELLPLDGDQLPRLLAAGTTKVVSICQRVAGDLLGDPHHRLLVDHQPVGVAEHVGEIVVVVDDRLAPVLAVGVVGVHVRRHRTRAIEGKQRGDVLEVGRAERSHQRPHRPAFELEHADATPPLQHVVGLRIVERHAVDVEVGIVAGADHLHGVGDHVEVAKAEEVHLEQPERLDAVHFVLGDDRCRLGVLARLGLALHRQIGGQRLLGDDDGGGVDAVGALQPLETAGNVDDALDVGVGVVHRPQLGRRLVPVGVLVAVLEAVLERCVATHHERWHRLGDAITDGIRHAQDTGRVADAVAGLDRAERDDLGDVLASVLLGRVADHLVAVTRVEVHVDVGHRDPARVEEALEQQVVADRVEIGDPQAVGHRAPGRRPPARTDADAVAPGVGDEIPDDEEVRREAHRRDRVELEVDALDDIGRQARSPQRRRAPSQVRWARYSSADVNPSGNGKSGSSTLPNSMSTSARSAIHSVLSHASGWSRNR